ncbi:MAG TPA: hypothetical protein VLV83_23275 [Acidobacteriota bacterium]|nr:hypothetical protein [Acidobacteriota bacterium]
MKASKKLIHKESRLGRRMVLVAALLYYLSTWIHFPPQSDVREGWPLLDLGVAAVGPPWALSGDSPHYLIMVHSLTEDADLDLDDDYASAAQGGLEAGQRFRGRQLDPHAERDDLGRLLPTHSPALAMLLALLSWPLAGSLWIEPWCIWLTTAAGLACLAWTAKRLNLAASGAVGQDWQTHPVLLLGLASPLWCYSVDLWTEPWTALAWMGLLFFRHPAALLAAGLSGTLIKYPFALVPAAMGAWAWWKGERTRALSLLTSSALGLAAAVGWVQWLYRDFSDHFSLFHSGIHAGFDWPFEGMAGLLLSPENGLLFFFPVLAWAVYGIIASRAGLDASMVGRGSPGKTGQEKDPRQLAQESGRGGRPNNRIGGLLGGILRSGRRKFESHFDAPAPGQAENGAFPLPRPAEALCGLAAYFLVHAAYEDWAGGTGFSARYLVPALPLLVLWVRTSAARSRLYQAALAYSALWSAVGGLAPALVYDRTPWGVLIHGLNYLQSL